MIQKLVLIAVAGGLGTLARFGLSGIVQHAIGRTFPWGTVCVNLVGCFGFGVLWAIMEDRLSVSGDVRIVVLVGFMGAFTTFSTFVFETGQLIEELQWMWALANLLIQNIVGIACLFVGLAIGRLL